MTTQLPGARVSDFKRWRYLRLALQTAASLQAPIRHADAKASILLGVQGGLSAAVAGCVPALRHGHGLFMPLTAAALSTVFMCGMAATTWHAVLALMPRLIGPRGPNRFAFPNVVASGSRPTSTDTQRLGDEAWDLVSTLAGIAMAKHQHLRRGLLWLVLAASSATGLLILTAIITLTA